MSNLVRANYEFWSGNPVELSFRPGDIIKVINREDAGWWEGELQGKRGLFPSNYVEPYTAINNYRAGGAQQQGQRWGNNNNQQQGGRNNNNNRGNGGGSTVGTGSNVGRNGGGSNVGMNASRNDGGSNVGRNGGGSNVGIGSNVGSNMNRNGGSSNVGTGYNNNNNNNNPNWNNHQNTWGDHNNNNNRNNQNDWNNNNNNNNSNWGNNHNNWNNNQTNGKNWNNNKWDQRSHVGSHVSDHNPMKKPANLDTYNNIVNTFQGQNQQQQPQQQQPSYQQQPRQQQVTPKTIDDPVKKPAALGPAQPRAKASPTKFGLWASALGDITGMTMIGVGFCGMLWGLIDLPHFGIIYVYTGIYSMVMGVFVYAFERSRWGQSRGPSRVPWRAICYLLISIFCFFSLATLILGLCCVVVAGANIIATVKGEVYDPPPKQSHDSSNVGYFANLYQYIVSFREQNKIGVLIFVGVYLASNIILFFVILWQFIKIAANTEATNPALATSYWVPYAKGFGNVLDYNCSIIVLPVCRTFLRMLYNRSTADQSFFARFLRGILYFIPIDKNIAFHKLIAKVIWISSVGHTVAHFINFAWTPSITYGIYGLSPFLTGGLLCAIILLMYSSSRDVVRRGQFEIFWYNHHLFIIFFLANIFHGKNSMGPNYYKWFAGPGALYLLERILRVYRANQKVVITSVTIMEDVFAIEIAKEGVFADPYKEGQYIFIQAPAISQIQWHPFTISSAPQEPTVTVHIRVCGEGSWTRGLRDYLASMGPRGRPFFQLDRQGPNGKLPGKILGPDGKPMLAIDGPHSAPTQHIGEYSTAMVAGAGIGITPVASTLKSIVFHRWKYFIGQCYPDHAYFVWVCSHKDVNAFRWLIRHIKDAQDEVTHMRATNPQNMATKTFEFHIYVSSVPKDQKPVDVVVDDEIGFWGVPREDAKVEKIRCAWDEADLYRTMLCPPAHTQLDDVHIWNGRPQWAPRFADIDRRHPNMEIGVMFCGNPAIGRDLRRMCQIYSKGRNQGIFKLHKENF